MGFVEKAKALEGNIEPYSSKITDAHRELLFFLWGALPEIIAVVEAARDAEHSYYHWSAEARLDRMDLLRAALAELNAKADSEGT